ncbi:RRP15-like protein [Venturia canescens]|uniref:RRP15-like protein n=1 Tax=Venturia canescens TaxID=32260 RepID=UPI001C9D0F5C|nr:RRP15-like protein [Venturia canescens]
MIVHESSAKRIKSLEKYRDSKAKEDKSEMSELKQSDNVEEDEDDHHIGTKESEGSGSENEKTTGNANAGWADVMQKILKTKKPKRKKSIVLSKAKKLNEVKHKEIVETVPFEIETETGEVKKEIVPKVEKKEDKSEATPLKRKRKDTQLGIRVKPSIKDREREKMLQKIATMGVVQLFNVVKQQQIDIDKKLDEVGPLERKREQVLKSIDKRAFLDVLMGGSKSITVDDPTKNTKVESTENNENDKVWSVLRDDFVMGAKLKDWDKKAPEDDNESTSSEEMDSD